MKRGFSLIEVLVAVGLMAVVTATMLNMFVNQNREIKAMEERMQTKDVKGALQSMLLSSAYCNCLFSGRTFDMSVTPNVINGPVTQIPSGFAPLPAPPCTPAGVALAQTGADISGGTIRVSGIDLINITDLNPGSGSYEADVAIQLDPASLVRPLKDITVKIGFLVNMATPAATRAFVSCVAAPPPIFFAEKPISQPAPPAFGIQFNLAAGPDFVWTTPAPVAVGKWAVTVTATVQPIRSGAMGGGAWYVASVNGSANQQMYALDDDEWEEASLRTVQFVYNVSVFPGGPLANQIEVRFLGSGSLGGLPTRGIWDLSVQGVLTSPIP